MSKIRMVSVTTYIHLSQHTSMCHSSSLCVCVHPCLSCTGVDNGKKYNFSTAQAVSCKASKDTSEEPKVDSPWQTVEWRQACSLDSAELVPKKTGQRGQAPKKEITAAATKQSNVATTADELEQPKAIQHR
jgi:hypothetical protein